MSIIDDWQIAFGFDLRFNRSEQVEREESTKRHSISIATDRQSLEYRAPWSDTFLIGNQTGTDMTNSKPRTRWLLGTLLIWLLSVAAASCSDDSKIGTSPAASGAEGTSRAGASGTNAGSTSADPNAAATCPSKVYAALSDGCKTCTCGLDPQLAPSCQKPCWDFLACSVRAQTGKCASFAAGGASMRPQFEACTMEECGAELAVPGAEVVSSYRSIVGACAVSMGGAKAACEDDVAKFISELAP